MFAQYNQQQATTSVSTGGLAWNGNAWVRGGGAAGASTLTPTTSTVSMPSLSPSTEPADLIANYTAIYHQWTARGKEHAAMVSNMPVMSTERAEAQKHVDWSKYYADQASRAAHHFHNTPLVPVPFDLPPAPPTVVTAAAVVVQKKPTPAAASTTANTDGGPPHGLKRYVHRNLEQFVTQQHKEAALRATEEVIAKALQEGTLHSTNWDTVALVTLPGVAAVSTNPYQQQFPAYEQQQQHACKKQKVSSTVATNHYGPSLGASSFSSSPWQPTTNQYQQQHQQSSGHYGPPATGAVASQQNTHSFYQSQQLQRQQQYGKYESNDNSDFIALPSSFGNKKNKKNNGGLVGKNKYVNPNSKTAIAAKKGNVNDAGFKRSSKKLNDRANRFAGPGGINDIRQASAKGIADRYMGKGVIGGSHKTLDETDYEHMKVKGTCQKLDKQYLRLTAPPKPHLVRPLPILQEHLTNLQAEWGRGPSARRDYLWFCAEMKALRQDLTVQHISNAFTCDVYETHARMALQEGDLNEFNQAQTQLKILYDKLREEDPKALKHENEFVAYRLIYFVMLTLNQKYTGGSSDVLHLMLSLSASQRKDTAIQHALQVRGAVADVDYHKFFLLNTTTPNLCDKLMGLMVPTVRHFALQRICRAYRPVADVSYSLKEIGLPVSSAKDLDSGKTFLMSCGCVLNDDGSEIKTKESTVRESDLQEKQSLI